MKPIVMLVVMMNFCFMSAFPQETKWDWSLQSFSSCQDQAVEMVIDDVNNCYLSGIYDSGEFRIGDSVFSGQDGDFKSFVSSFDRDGNFRWAVSLQKETGGVFGMVANCLLAVDSQQNLYVTGIFDFSVDFGDTILYSLGNWDVFVAKYDSSGQFIWAYHIGGPADDQVGDIKIDAQNNIYLGMYHSRPLLDNYIVYGDNDTTVNFRDYAASVLSLGVNAEFSWLSCGTSSEEVQINNLVLDNENNLYAQFLFFGDFLINGDTITADLLPYTHLVIPYDANGNPGEYRKFSHYWVLDMVIDNQGDFINTGVFNEPIVILGDTLTPGGYYDQLLVKYNHEMEPLWYITFPNRSDMLDFVIDLDRSDGIYISSSFEGEQALGDTTLQWEGMKGIFIAKLNPSGNLEWAATILGTDFQYSSALNLDHCGNILVGGGFNREIYPGQDTLTGSAEIPNVFIAKLSNEIGFLNLGNDIIACGSLLLSAPAGYNYYSWNNGSSFEDHFMVNETGSYSLLAVDEHYCTDSDTIFVEIKPLPQADLGRDTLIFISDTLYFTVDPQVDSILWSDGSSGPDFIFNARDYGEGVHTVWVQFGVNGCYNSDSINIQVVDNSYLDEHTFIIGNLYPNPASDILTVICHQKTTVNILNIEGQIIQSIHIDDKEATIDLRDYSSGIYFLKAITDEGIVIRKFIKR